MQRFIPICPKCGREGHFPKDCPWAISRFSISQASSLGTMLTVAAVIPFGSAALVIHFVMFI